MKLKTSALLAASVLALCTACGQPAPPDPAPAAPGATTTSPSAAAEEPGAAEDPSLAEKKTLAFEAARIMTTWTPAKDFNRTAAEQRASHLMTEQRAQEIVVPERPAGGAQWLKAAEKKATSQPRISLEEEHHATDTMAVVSTWQWVSPDGDSFAGEESYLFHFTFTDEKPYKIRDYTYTSR